MQCTYDAKQLTDIINIIWVAEWEGKYVRWGARKKVDIQPVLSREIYTVIVSSKGVAEKSTMQGKNSFIKAVNWLVCFQWGQDKFLSCRDML